MGTANTISQRIKMARLQLGYSRKAFSLQCNIPTPTLQAWESARYPITTKGLTRYINALLSAGLKCSHSWLLHGTPPAPRLLINKINPANESTIEKTQQIENQLLTQSKLLQEINFFESLYKDIVVTLIKNDTMLPFYKSGDYVGGRKLNDLPPSHQSEHAYIIKLTTGEILVRFVIKGDKKNTYHLFISNIHMPINKPWLYNQSIDYLAPILWHRKYPFY